MRRVFAGAGCSRIDIRPVLLRPGRISTGRISTGRSPASRSPPSRAFHSFGAFRVTLLTRLGGAHEVGTDERLPSVRQLASDLEVAPGTVAKAYRPLEAEGLVVSRVGSETRVSEQVAVVPSSVVQAARRLVTIGRREGLDLDAVIRVLRTMWGARPSQPMGDWLVPPLLPLVRSGDRCPTRPSPRPRRRPPKRARRGGHVSAASRPGARSCATSPWC